MSAKDTYHDTVIAALKADGWKITHDPLTLSYGGKDLYVDLGAERIVIAAEREEEKIAVEIKSFLSTSPVHDLKEAVGQYSIYHSVLSEMESDRPLFLAVPQRAWEGILTSRLGQLIIDKLGIRLIIFDSKKERIVRWMQ